MSAFRRLRAGISVRLDPVEKAALAQIVSEMAQLTRPEPKADDGEAWARELGLGGLGAGGGPLPPSDPVRARLFPDAYRDDPAAADDFRRFTESELRAGKFANARVVLDSLTDGGPVLLDDEQSAAWLGALNDARLALGTALDVDQNTEEELVTLEVDDPRARRLSVYVWLGDLQGSLLYALTGDSD